MLKKESWPDFGPDTEEILFMHYFAIMAAAC